MLCCSVIQWLTLWLPVVPAANFTHLPHLPDPWRHLIISYNSPFMMRPVAQRATGATLPINAELVRGKAKSLGRVLSYPTSLPPSSLRVLPKLCQEVTRTEFSLPRASCKDVPLVHQSTRHAVFEHFVPYRVMCTCASVPITCNASLSSCSAFTNFPGFS